MKKLMMAFCVMFFIVLNGCGDGGFVEFTDVNYVSLPGTYILDSININESPGVDFISGYITFDKNNKLYGEFILVDDSKNCVFDGMYYMKDDYLYFNIINTTNINIIDIGTTRTSAIFIKGIILQIGFYTDETLYNIKYK